MNNRDWCGVVGSEDMYDFLTDRLNINVNEIQKHQNDKYGTYFVVFVEDKVVDPVLYFGKYGKLNITVENNELVFADDFQFSLDNHLFMQEYAAFMHEHNKINNACRKLGGKTYVLDFNENLKKFNEQKENVEKNK